MSTSCLRKFVAATLGFLLTFALALAAPVKFDIPAQPAPAALKTFIKQSGAQVVFNASDLKDVKAHEGKGDYEPLDALSAVVKDAGFDAASRESGIFVVVKGKVTQTSGSIRGSLTGAGGVRLANVLISIKETAQSAETDRYG